MGLQDVKRRCLEMRYSVKNTYHVIYKDNPIKEHESVVVDDLDSPGVGRSRVNVTAMTLSGKKRDT